MSVSSESDSSHRSGGESDREGLAASSHESEASELPDTPKQRRNKQNQGMAWILRGEITTTLLHNDMTSMDCDDADD